MVMMFVEGVVLVLDGIFVLFLPYKSYGVGVFIPTRTLIALKLPKVNTEKPTFCALKIEYLGYILTRDGIKPQSNKVQATFAIQPPKGVKQLRHFLGMMQY
jgi:hypothetical protein